MTKLFGRIGRTLFRRRASFVRYPSFESAQEAAAGYQDPRIVATVAEKTHRYIDNLDPSRGVGLHLIQTGLAVCMARTRPQIDVLELGGACGATFFELDARFPDAIRSWTILETSAMADVGRANFATQKLSFVDRVDETLHAKAFDLAVAQGALQYTPDPLRAIVALTDLEPTIICITRTSMALRADGLVHGVQRSRIADHGPGVLAEDRGEASTPMTLLSRETYLGAISSDYSLVLPLDEGSSWFVEDIEIREGGFIARRREP